MLMDWAGADPTTMLVPQFEMQPFSPGADVPRRTSRRSGVRAEFCSDAALPEFILWVKHVSYCVGPFAHGRRESIHNKH